MPSDFPFQEYETVNARAAPLLAGQAELSREFGAAWNAVAYRFQAVVEHGESVSASLSKHGAGPPSEERYRQERDLYGFFASGYSTLEAAFYGLHFVGAYLRPDLFQIKNKRQIGAPSGKLFTAAFPADQLGAVWAIILEDPAYKTWGEIRNVLIHRTAPGRAIKFGGEDRWNLNDLEMTSSMPIQMRAELARMLSGLLSGATRFAETRL
jgi:hypothetical protein